VKKNLQFKVDANGLIPLGHDLNPPCEENNREKTVYKIDWAGCLNETATVEELGFKKVNVPHVKEAFLLYNIFSKKECQSLIEAMEKLGFGKTPYPKKYRGNLRLMLHEKKVCDTLWNRMKTFVPEEVVSDGWRDQGKENWESCGLNDKLRCSKYYPGDVFGQHCDAAFIYSDLKRSHFTVNIYLNKEFEGGCTRFFPHDLINPVSVHPEPGMALIFRQPPDQNLTHDGELVRGGLKYLLRTDVMYNKTK